MNTRPRIAVLMATYNGCKWIDEQINSILVQVDVDVTIFVSDDFSTDGTFEKLQNFSIKEPNITLLSRTNRFAAAGRNFYRLLCEAPIEDFDCIAFSDQDDIWNPNKLIKHYEILRKQNVEGVSSNVMAFWPDQTQFLVSKSQPQKKWDFIFESAGPGCSFLITPWLVAKLREEIQSTNSPAKNVVMHDWLTYAICRSHKRRWIIDPVPSLIYRQHANNVIGANSGIKAIVSRLRKINDGWYRGEVSKICEVAVGISPDSKLIKLSGLLKARTLMSQLQLLPYVFEGRRKFIDRIVLGITIFLFVF